MISGPSIDDQRAIRIAPPPLQLQNGMQAQVQAAQPVRTELADSDEERDPGDFAAIPATAPLEHGGLGTYGDDDSDYGQSDSD